MAAECFSVCLLSPQYPIGRLLCWCLVLSANALCVLVCILCVMIRNIASNVMKEYDMVSEDSTYEEKKKKKLRSSHCVSLHHLYA